MENKSNLVVVKNLPIVNMGDILWHCEANGYSWNQAHSILWPHGNGALKFGHLRKEYFNGAYDFGHSDEINKIMLSFCEIYELEEFYLTKKGFEV